MGKKKGKNKNKCVLIGGFAYYVPSGGHDYNSFGLEIAFLDFMFPFNEYKGHYYKKQPKTIVTKIKEWVRRCLGIKDKPPIHSEFLRLMKHISIAAPNVQECDATDDTQSKRS